MAHVYSAGEVRALIAGVLGIDDLDGVRNVTLICHVRTDDEDVDKIFWWDSNARYPGGEPDQMGIVASVVHDLGCLIKDIRDNDERSS
jgi:hypothetical protein